MDAGLLSQLKWTVDTLKRFESCAEKKVYDNGEVLFLLGSESDRVYLIESGFVKVCHYTRTGNSVTLFIHEKGELVGAGAILNGTNRAVYAVSMGRSVIWAVSGEDFMSFLKNDSNFAIYVATDFAARLQKMDQRVLHVTSFSASQRVAGLLCDFVTSQKRERAETAVVYITHQEISDLTGACRQTVTKILHKFKEKGILETKKGAIVITDADSLKQETGNV